MQLPLECTKYWNGEVPARLGNLAWWPSG